VRIAIFKVKSSFLELISLHRCANQGRIIALKYSVPQAKQ
jgi:hypothetical protein